MLLSIKSTLLSITWAVAAIAQDAVDDMSFGHKQGISPNSFAIPGWAMLGEGHVPQLLSDKVILTPPYGGHKKGCLWTERANSLENWMVNFKFRAGAPDRGGGNLQLWYAANGEKQISTSSIYTVGKWEGLAIVIDTVGGTQKIRGFLNDGSIEYKSHANVDSLAFGHCDSVYRNLGRPSHINLKYTSTGGIELLVDGKTCFATNRVTLPPNYYFGVAASSFDPPDSFEVFEFALSSITAAPPVQQQQQQQQQQQIQDQSQPATHQHSSSSSQLATSEAQFADLHNRLNQLSKSIQNMFTEINRHTAAEEARYKEILSKLPDTALINGLNGKVANLDKLVSNLERELKSSDHSTQFRKLSEQIEKTHVGVTEHVPQRLREYVQSHTPRIGFILYSFMAFQTCCVGVFVWYKWRKSTMPKKYL
ncbi:uncharacterized protein A1O9_11810 [Exophiala aquamarina CBS 119918]|uniref:L-type lectin-like domain-containing protein n=1 Tax=Exophiala aquamarina CBS 119918 TaxID=1182545 RepID=A0A072NYT7_9EURO|nr:uncharacterized protein A1O9_11810 [Exophiala aquamarina CBS 119918]KEF52183.1 hypothetical protein A1O9_11810 [Exophiala aquamarina CBS 119918]